VLDAGEVSFRERFNDLVEAENAEELVIIGLAG
jgi:hypothetical protein